MFRGALHIHTTYSDGEFTLAELRVALYSVGCRFACVTDHAEGLDDARLEDYRRECAARSDADFLFIPGLEYGCANRMHILGYGVTAPIASDRPEDVIAEIRRLGGIAVIAHPRTEAFETIERFSPRPDGIEVWNTKYDGQWAPRPGTFDLLRRMRAQDPRVGAFYGLDLHWRRQYRQLLVDVDAADLSRAAILSALAAGGYSGNKDDLRLPSDGVIAPALAERFGRTNNRAQAWRRRLSKVKGWTDRAGIRMPAPLKAQLRRIF